MKKIYTPLIHVATIENEKNARWLYVNDFKNYDEFIDYCEAFFDVEGEELYFGGDYQDIPNGFILPNYVSPFVFDLKKYDDGTREILSRYMDAFECESGDFCTLEEAVAEAKDAFVGHFDNLADLGRHWAEDGNMNIPDEIEPFFDYEKYGAEVAEGLRCDDGYYFTAF